MLHRLFLISIMLVSTADASTHTVYNEQDVVLENITLSSDTGACLHVRNAQTVVIKNASIGPCAGVGVHIEFSDNVQIIDSYIRDASGLVYALQSTNVLVTENLLVNPQGPLPRGQAVQFNRSNGQIVKNSVICDPALCNAEDLVNLFRSSDTVVSHNKFVGGTSHSGCGVLVGDYGGNGNIVANNTFKNTGSCGIGVAGGHRNIVMDNTVCGTSREISNIGVYVWAQGGVQCSDTIVTGNKINWLNARGNKNDLWTSENCGPVIGETDNTLQSAACS